jgi:hypothetical protein
VGKGIHIKIDEISNGYTVELCSVEGKAGSDRTVFNSSLTGVLELIDAWLKEIGDAEE